MLFYHGGGGSGGGVVSVWPAMVRPESYGASCVSGTVGGGDGESLRC